MHDKSLNFLKNLFRNGLGIYKRNKQNNQFEIINPRGGFLKPTKSIGFTEAGQDLEEFILTNSTGLSIFTTSKLMLDSEGQPLKTDSGILMKSHNALMLYTALSNAQEVTEQLREQVPAIEELVISAEEAIDMGFKFPKELSNIRVQKEDGPLSVNRTIWITAVSGRPESITNLWYNKRVNIKKE